MVCVKSINILVLKLKKMFKIIIRVVPWVCESGFLRRIVPDAAPQHEINKGSPEPRKHTNITDDVTILANNNNKVTPLIVNRSASIGERVL